MNKATRVQSIFNVAYDLHLNSLPITLDAIYKRLDSKIPKTTISDDLKYMRSFVIPKGKRWILTSEGLEAARKGDIFQFSLIC